IFRSVPDRCGLYYFDLDIFVAWNNIRQPFTPVPRMPPLTFVFGYDLLEGVVLVIGHHLERISLADGDGFGVRNPEHVPNGHLLTSQLCPLTLTRFRLPSLIQHLFQGSPYPI